MILFMLKWESDVFKDRLRLCFDFLLVKTEILYSLLGMFLAVTVTVSGVTPTVLGGNVFKTRNASASFTVGVDSQRIMAGCGDPNTIIQKPLSIVTASGSDVVCSKLHSAAEFIRDNSQAGLVQNAGQNDHGTKLKTTIDSQFAKVNPWNDIRAYGARAETAAEMQSTTGSISSGSTVLTLAAAWTGVNGDGIVCRACGATTTLTTPGAGPAVTPSLALDMIGTGRTVSNTSGATTYQYQFIAIGKGGDYAAASPVTSISNGPKTLGATTADISCWTRSNGTVTVTTSSSHNLVFNALIKIKGNSGVDGWYRVATVPSGTTFTFTTGEDTRAGAMTSGGATGTVVWWQGNHIVIPHQTNAWKYAVYGRTSGTNVFLGYTLPDNPNYSADPTYNVFDDWGSKMTAAPSTVPDWLPNSPPISAKNADLVTTIVSGAGTNALTLVAAATNTVSGVVVKHDNAPNIIAAAIAVFGNFKITGPLYIPTIAASTQSFITNSVLDFTAIANVGTPSVIQLGTLTLGDTMIWGSMIWDGKPINPTTMGGQFFWQKQARIQSRTAFPMIYSINPTQFSSVTISNNSNSQGTTWVMDCDSSIPHSRFEHVGFFGSPSDFTGTGLLIRNNISHAANFNFDYLNFVYGPDSNDESPAPLFLNTQGLGPFTMNHLMINHRAIYLGSATTGVTGTIDSIYCQACIMPHITLANSTGNVPGIALEVRTAVIDTSTNVLIAYFDNVAGSAKIFGVNSNNLVSGAGTMSVVANNNLSIGQNLGIESSVTSGNFAIDGILSRSSAPYPIKRVHGGLLIGAPYKAYVSALPQAAPTCSVGIGGTVPPATHTFAVAPVFPDGGEGPPSHSSSSCKTTSGHQTVTINWPTVPGAIGYDLYRNGFSFQCTTPWVSPGSKTKYIWSSAAPCGQSQTNTAGSGPTGFSRTNIWTPQLTMVSTDLGGRVSIAMPVATGAHNINIPDAPGTVLLDSTIGSSLRMMLTSTYTNATTTASNITGLSFLVAANTNYTWTCNLYYQGSASTAGLDITITGPASPTNVFYSYDEDTGAKSLNSGVANAFGTKITGNLTVLAMTNLHATVTLGFMNGANSGTVQLQGSATGVGTVTIQPGSFCRQL